MVGYPFRLADGSDIRYSVGNPMGFYSSWASFALSHHFVVFWCCEELNIRWSTAKYVILGDDILIGDDRLGELYRTKILSLGVEISEQKSFTSTEVCEFAKRYIFRGEEVSPFPLSSVQNNLGDVSLLVASVMGEERKGFISKSGIPSCISSLAKRLGKRAALARKYEERARDAELATLLFQRKIDPVEFVLRACRSDDAAYLDSLQSYGLEILSAAVRSLIQPALERGSVSLEKALYEDLFKIHEEIRRYGVPGHYSFLVPAFGAYNEFEEAVSKIQELGFRALVEDGHDLLEVIGEVSIDPLRESVWGLSRRKRQVRANSRLARACREIGVTLRDGGDPAVFGRFMPPMPMKEVVKTWSRQYSRRR